MGLRTLVLGAYHYCWYDKCRYFNECVMEGRVADYDTVCPEYERMSDRDYKLWRSQIQPRWQELHFRAGMGRIAAMPNEESVILLMGKTAMDKKSYLRQVPRIDIDKACFRANKKHSSAGMSAVSIRRTAFC